MSVPGRIIKNTGFLYIKMGITVFLSLYTTRIILGSLGETDFGIFALIGGSIALLNFLNSTMASATQRFMSYAQGEGDLERQREVFNISFLLHLLVAALTLIMLLAIIHPLFHGWLNIPPDRIFASKIVYLSLIVSTLLSIINVPYEAVMNAHENMLYYSIIGVLETLLRLGIAFIVVYTDSDKLIVYGVLMAGIPLITLTVMKIYCHRHYEECRFALRKYWNPVLVRRIASFSGWNFLTAISYLFSAQGIGLVLNHFFGPVLNATQGIANQLNAYMSSFSLNLMKAVSPVIVKKAGSREVDSMNLVSLASGKFSTVLILFFCVPASLEMPYVLQLWLKDVPPWAVTFCVLQLVQTVVCQITSSISTSIYARGKIKHYAIWKSLTNASPLFFAWIAFTFGGGPFWLYIPMLVVWGIGGDIVILHYAARDCELKVSDFVRQAMLPVLIVSAAMTVCGGAVVLAMPQGFVRLLLCCVATTIGMAAAMYRFGLNPAERQYILAALSRLPFLRKSNN